jgi:hypothetical protein
MPDWKALQDTNPEPSLLDAIAHAENKTMGHFADQARQALAEDILIEAEVIAEFEDNVTISIPKDLWDEFCGREQDK